MVEILCPHCDEQIELDDDSSGVFACPHCEQEFEWNVDSAPSKSDGKVADIEIVDNEGMKMVKVILNGNSIRSESGALHYMQGDIEMQTKATNVGGFLKSMASGENIFRPTYKGTGEVYFGPPTLGEYHILEVEGEMILDQGAYICSDIDIEVGVFRNKGMSMIAGGEGIFQTSVKGKGNVVVHAHGPLQVIHLENDTLTVDGSFAVARDASLQFTTQMLGKSALSKIASGEGFVNVIRGTGRVYLAPVPNKLMTLMNGIQSPFGLE